MAAGHEVEVMPAQGEDQTRGAHVAVIGEYPAAAASVRQVRDAVARLAASHGAGPGRVDDVRLAVSEAVTNVVMHAYEQHQDGMFRTLAVVGDDRMLVIIEDDGCGLSTPARTPGLGAGLRVMREVAEVTRFCEREHGGSSVQMLLPLQA